MPFKKGNTYWKQNIGRKASLETRKKLSKKLKEFYKNNPNKIGFKKGHKSFKGCEKSWFTTERMKGNTNGFIKGNIPWHKNLTKEEIKKHYKDGWKIVHYSGEEHWNWQGGKSFEIYPKKFKIVRKEILELQQVCQLCKSEKFLVVHHIDKNKKNNNIDNLVVLCRRCHGKVHQGGLKCLN